MKKIAFVLAMAFAQVFAASPSKSQPVRVINVCHLTDNNLNEIMQGHHPDMVVEFPAQTTLPLSFFLNGDLVNLVENEGKCGMLAVKQTFYARCVGEALLLSTNLKDWRPFLDFITGTTSVTLSIQDGQPSVVIGAETNRRS